jgi:hypothetical protein
MFLSTATRSCHELNAGGSSYTNTEGRFGATRRVLSKGKLQSAPESPESHTHTPFTHRPLLLHVFGHGLSDTAPAQSLPNAASALACSPSFQKHLQTAPDCSPPRPAKQKPRPEHLFGHKCIGTSRSRCSGSTRTPSAPGGSHARPQSGIPVGSRRLGLYFTTGALTRSSTEAALVAL